MRLTHILAGAAACAVALSMAAIVPASASAAATTANYAALGDSYSSGVGTDDYYSNSGSCDRSPESYAALWAAAHSVSNFDFAACSGAKTTDVLSGQLGGLSASTNLITMNIGGNDAGFSSVMTTCIEDTVFGDSGCLNAVSTAETFVRNSLPGLLDTLYAKIKSDAPNAKVIIVGYPDFYQVPGTCSVGLSDTERTAIDGGADLLDSTINTEVGKYGFTFDDVRSAFSAHEICSSSAWINSVDWTNITESYHPTANGYADADLPSLDAITG
ncbi:MAG TPA: SGNH/GDSL hydrolase family protein [Pseudonocardiaceae bacterium]|nr:SGNH/GDSL hydrolase family protein [Pseudonocardiaceae bacterium]